MKYLITLLLVGTQVQAAPFSEYRRKLASPEQAKALTQEAADRVRQLRRALGTDKLSYESLKGGAVAELSTSKLSKGTKKTASGLVKKWLGPVAEKMREQESQGAPPPFDPSKFDTELDQEKSDRRFAFCDQHMGALYRPVVNELVFDLKKEAAAAVPATPAVTALEAKLMAAIQKAIPADIAKKLGQVTGVDFIDGRVVRFQMTDSAGAMVPLNLSMLATMRTVRDRYFLITLECVRRHVQKTAAEEKPQDAGYQELAKFLSGPLNSRVQSAGRIHEKLSLLSRAELNRLIDIFLVLAQGDVPSETEMSVPDEPKKWKPGMQPPSFPAYVYQLTDPAVIARDKALDARKVALDKRDARGADAAWKKAVDAISPVQDELADYQYFHLMNEQLYQLQDWVFEETERERQEQKRIDAVSEGM